MSMKSLLSSLSLASVLVLAGASAHAALVSVTGQGVILSSAPTDVTNTTVTVTNGDQWGFDEQQGVLLANSLGVDGGSIAAGTVVNSHLIFLNIPTTSGSASAIATWVFDGLILGVMSDAGGTLEALSTPILGATGTTYEAPLANRGLELGTSDGYTILGNTLTVNMNVAQPGDWIRVVTAVPEPGTLGLIGAALASLALVRRRGAR